ncbi:hypothetical protein [Streptomyces capparidis]
MAVIMLVTSVVSALNGPVEERAQRRAAVPGGAAASARAGGDERAALLKRAEERLIRRCMERAGFRYQERRAEREPRARQFPFVVDDVAWARAHGYGSDRARRPAGKGGATPGAAYPAGLSPERRHAWKRALEGTGRQLSVRLAGGVRISASDRGCAARARAALYRDLPRWYRAEKITQNLDGFVREKVTGDARYTRAEARWSACMRDRGFPGLSGPGELRRRLDRGTRGLTAAKARAEEARTAVAEAACATSTPLARTARALDREHRAAVRARFRQEFTDLARLREAAVPRARAVLGED